MTPPLSSLEYEEEDLFGSDDETAVQATLLTSLSTVRPIPVSSAASSSVALSSKQPRAPTSDAEKRLAELRERKRGLVEEGEGSGRGVSSLKSCCLTVIRANSSRIWDVGDMEYPVIHTFLDELPMDQLVVIESISSHIKGDTDWLWEIFLLQDFPLFYERCRERKGEERTSGWRRMYKKAEEDAKERQSHAADRIAERYRQLDEEKAAKRIVFVDKVVTKGKRRGGGAMRVRAYGNGISAPRAGLLPAPHPTAAATALARARVDSQRARVALTHASGKCIPPFSRPKPKIGETELFKNPYLSSASTNPSSLSRLPPPPSRPVEIPIAKPGLSSPPTSLIPGSYPTASSAHLRAALPAHLVKSPRPPSPLSAPARFRLPDAKPFKEIPKPSVENFEPPKAARPEQMDFFGERRRQAPKGLVESLSRTRKEEVHSGEKRKSLEGGAEVKRRAREDDTVSITSPRSAPPTPIMRPSTSGGSLSADESARLSSVLFRKKAKPRSGTGRIGA